MEQTEEKKPYTWAQLKEFCNSRTEEQLSKPVRVIREDEVMRILEAAEIGEDHYKFDDDEYSVTKDDFDPDQNCDGKYESFEHALENEDYIFTPASAIFLFEDF